MQFTPRGPEEAGVVRDLLRVIVEVGGLLLAAHRLSIIAARRKDARIAAKLRRQLDDLAMSQRKTRDPAPTEGVQHGRNTGSVRLAGRRFTEETGA